MSIHKRGKKGIYQIRFTAPNGERIRISAGTNDRKQAEELEQALKEQYWRIIKLNEKPSKLWEEAVTQWFKDKIRENLSEATLKGYKIALRWLNPYMRGKPIHTIDEEFIRSIKERRIAQGNLKESAQQAFIAEKLNMMLWCRMPSFAYCAAIFFRKPTSNESINRLLEVIKTILNHCRELKWINHVPKIKLLPKNQEGWHWITKETAKELLKNLSEDLRVKAEFTLETGLRKTNLVRCKKTQVDLANKQMFRTANEMKNKNAFAIPLSERAIEIIKEQMGKYPDSDYLFPYQGKPVKETNTKAWRKAVRKTGIQRFRWHDLRHTWASWHVQKGTPLHILMKLGGWKSLAMVLRYAHFETAHLVPYVPRSQLD